MILARDIGPGRWHGSSGRARADPGSSVVVVAGRETATSSDLDFEHRVVIVTGAGRNLGREYALALAARGARVLVNDLGVPISDTDGRGDETVGDPAGDVVDEIRASGGVAVANRDTIATVDGGRSIVENALDEWGRVDAVVNNAGQVRLAPFDDFPEESLDALIDTQLRGTVNVSRPAWRAMRARADGSGGRIVNVSSGAAFGGVPDGTMYAMAKMGVIGLTRGMASEGRAHGIFTNVVVPYAKTRPGTGFGPIPWSDELGEWLDPAQVAPVVVWLSHPSCELNGETICVGGGWYAGVETRLAAGVRDRAMRPADFSERTEELLHGGETPITAFGSRAVRHLMDGFRPPEGGAS